MTKSRPFNHVAGNEPERTSRVIRLPFVLSSCSAAYRSKRACFDTILRIYSARTGWFKKHSSFLRRGDRWKARKKKAMVLHGLRFQPIPTPTLPLKGRGQPGRAKKNSLPFKGRAGVGMGSMVCQHAEATVFAVAFLCCRYLLPVQRRPRCPDNRRTTATRLSISSKVL